MYTLEKRCTYVPVIRYQANQYCKSVYSGPYVCWVSNTVHRASSITQALYDVHTFLTRLGKSIIHV